MHPQSSCLWGWQASWLAADALLEYRGATRLASPCCPFVSPPRRIRDLQGLLASLTPPPCLSLLPFSAFLQDQRPAGPAGQPRARAGGCGAGGRRAGGQARHTPPHCHHFGRWVGDGWVGEGAWGWWVGGQPSCPTARPQAHDPSVSHPPHPPPLFSCRRGGAAAGGHPAQRPLPRRPVPARLHQAHARRHLWGAGPGRQGCVSISTIMLGWWLANQGHGRRHLAWGKQCAGGLGWVEALAYARAPTHPPTHPPRFCVNCAGRAGAQLEEEDPTTL